jgi:hypothetical protein
MTNWFERERTRSYSKERERNRVRALGVAALAQELGGAWRGAQHFEQALVDLAE